MSVSSSHAQWVSVQLFICPSPTWPDSASAKTIQRDRYRYPCCSHPHSSRSASFLVLFVAPTTDPRLFCRLLSEWPTNRRKEKDRGRSNPFHPRPTLFLQLIDQRKQEGEHQTFSLYGSCFLLFFCFCCLSLEAFEQRGKNKRDDDDGSNSVLPCPGPLRRSCSTCVVRVGL